MAMVFALMHNSSRGHRIVVESAVVLLLALPITGMQIASDANRALDRSDSVYAAGRIAGLETRRHRRRSGSYNTFHVFLAPTTERAAIDLPREIVVPVDVFERAGTGKTLEAELGRGWLGRPWYRAIRIVD
jgi:hypothetical protein